MTEAAMLVGLGVLGTLLLVLLALPALQARANRLAQRRAERLFPMSMAEIQADRDHVRAETALRLREAERRWEQASASRQQALVEVGRRDTEIAARKIDISERDARIMGLEATLANARAEGADLTRELGEERALHARHREELAIAVSTLAKRERALGALAVERADLAADRARLEAALQAAETLAATRASELAQRTALIVQQQADLAAGRRQIDTLLGDLADAQALASARGAEIEVLRMQGEGARETARTERRLREEAEASLAETARALAAAQGEIATDARRLAALDSRRVALERDLAEAAGTRALLEQRVQSLQGEYERMREALRAASLERAREGAERQSALRAAELAIARLGEDLARRENEMKAVRGERDAARRAQADLARRLAGEQDEATQMQDTLRGEIARVGELFLMATGRGRLGAGAAMPPATAIANAPDAPRADTQAVGSDEAAIDEAARTSAPEQAATAGFGAQGLPPQGTPMARPRRRRPPVEAAE